tara:strand:+ start:2008 stop:2217 length:210 start_codon:yes stop_codon:yes gene_type:complete
MDATKWKSVAVKVEDHKLLKAVSKHNYRGPAAQITKMLDEEVEKLSISEGVDQEAFKKSLLDNLNEKVL